MEVPELAAAAADLAELVSAAAGFDDLPTPCTEWRVADLVSHLVGENLLFGAAVGGSAAPDIGGYRASADYLSAQFGECTDPTRRVQIVGLPGERSVAELSEMQLTDAVIHSWDLAVAIGAEYDPPPDSVVLALRRIEALPAQARGEGRPFGASHAVDGNAFRRLLGLSGRDPEPWELRRALGWAESEWVDALTRVAAADLSRPSGCADWSVRNLVDHVIGGGHRYAMLLDGADAAATAATRDTDYVGDDALAGFRRYEGILRAAMERADLAVPVDHRAGPRSGSTLIRMRVMDLVLHTKDLCDGIGIDWEPRPALCEWVLTEASPVIEELRGIGLFGPAVAPATDSPRDRLLGFAGRS